MLMAMVQRSRLMQQETLWARVNGLREGGSTMDTQMCSSLKPVEVLVWKIFLEEKHRNPWWHFLKSWVVLFSLYKVNWPEAGNLVVLCSIKGFLGHVVSMVNTQPAVTKEVKHLPCLEVLYGHLVYIPFYKTTKMTNLPYGSIYVGNANVR